MSERQDAQIRHADATGMVDGSRDRLSVLAEQQAALRRVATLVARGASPSEVFAAVAEEMANCLHAGNAGVIRFDGDTATIVALANLDPGLKHRPVVGDRGTVEGDNWATEVRRTGQVLRSDRAGDGTGLAADRFREMGINSVVAAPIMVDGHIWGVVTVASYDPLPADTEERISDFAELVATAIANATARDELRELAEQQAALRQVATLVARGVGSSEVFSAVAEQMAQCLHVGNAAVCRFEGDEVAVVAVSQFEPSIKNTPVVGERFPLEGDNFATRVLRTGRPAHQDNSEWQNAPGPIAARLREVGLGRYVGVPIVVDGRVWGMASVGAPERLPRDTEKRLGDFAELVATAIANAAARDELRELAEQQAALRRVATLVAQGVGSAELFNAVADEMALCLHVENATVIRYEPDGTVIIVSGHFEPGPDNRSPVGERFSLEGDNIAALVLDTGCAARIGDHDNATGALAARAREQGLRCVVGAPVLVEGRVWGTAVVASTRPEPLPAGTEARLGDFAELVATAIANAAARDELRELAEQQAALRRVATLVARGVASSEVFAAVAEEMVQRLDVESAGLFRYEAADGWTIVAFSDPAPERRLPVGERMTLEGENLAAMVLRTGRAARMDSFDNAAGSTAALARELGVRGGVAVPVVVDGRLWGGAYVASMVPEPLPPDTEARLSDFGELVATAIANAAAREELRGLARQQAALRRVATLVARGSRPSEVYSAVAEEIVNCLDVDSSGVWRYESDEEITLLAGASEAGVQYFPIGERLTIEGDNLGAMVLGSGRSARHHWFESDAGSAIARIRELGIREGVGAPIIVEGRVWGLAVAATTRPEPLPPDIEERIGDFADLVATALANAAANDELIASRARIVVAADDTRRRIERDLHDGAQQRLVSLGLHLRLAEDSVPDELGEVREWLSSAMSGVTAVSSELQRISRGIHPAIQSVGGLGPALKLLARQCPVPVRVDVAVKQRLPDPVEVAAYYVVAEALTNAAKYADASRVIVCVEIKEDNLCLSIQDDGIGGADSRKGSGLIGLKDRVEVLGGHIKVISPPGNGTSLHVTIPL